jgi:hypothetical protein
MNWKRGIQRFVLVVSICVGGAVLFLGSSALGVDGLIDAHDSEDAAESFITAVLAFGIVWGLYGLSIFVYRGFQKDDPNRRRYFWQWVTGRFSPENDPYRKKEKQRKRSC